jgi:hypothetical protein
MTDLLDGLRRVVVPDRVAAGDEIRLSEANPASICRPVLVAYRGSFWALRVESNDHLKLLVGSKDNPLTSFNRLPDWVVFCEPGKRARKSCDLWALVCELKSGGKRADSARRQVQLGRFLVEYLIRVATFATGSVKTLPRLDVRGLIVYPGAPAQKGTTGAGSEVGPFEVDAASDMAIYRASDDDDVRIEDLFG